MKKLILILASLILVGCANVLQTNKPLAHFVHGENIFARELYTSGYSEFSKVYYHASTFKFEDLERLKAEILQKCKNEWKNTIVLGFTNLEEGCSILKEDDERIYNSKKYKDIVAKIESEKIKKEEAVKQSKRDEELKIKREKIARVELVYSSKCKKFKQGSSEYENCLFENEKLALEEQKRLSTLPAAERYAYTCEKTYGFKKGSDNFRDCVFKIMTTEYEIQRATDQRRIAELESKINNNSSSYNSELLEIERLKAKALQDQANAIRNRNQTDALMDLSRSLLNNNNRAPANVPNLPLNCRSVRVGNTVQTQCY